MHIKTVNGARKVDVGKLRRMFCLPPPTGRRVLLRGRNKGNMASSFVILLLYEPSFKEWASENRYVLWYARKMVFLRESYLIHPLILFLFDPFVTAASAFWGKLSNGFRLKSIAVSVK